MKDRLFAVGDIHGCFDALQKLIENELILRKSDKLVLLGDYIDRGYQSKEVVDYLMYLLREGYDVIPLLGNHEAMLLQALHSQVYYSNWLQNGGATTLYSFCIDSIRDFGEPYLTFFKSLRLFYAVGNILFVHAGFNDAAENPFDDNYAMLWTRSETYTHPLLEGKIIIHGHTPITLACCSEQVAQRNRVINIDTGCVYSSATGYGRLTALEMYSYNLFSV